MKAYKKNQIAKTTTDRRQYHIVCCTEWKEWYEDFNSEYLTTKRSFSGFKKKKVIKIYVEIVNSLTTGDKSWKITAFTTLGLI